MTTEEPKEEQKEPTITVKAQLLLLAAFAVIGLLGNEILKWWLK
jgi:hypothetical protein